MKLTDILREVEGEEDGMKQLKVQYDLAIQPTDISAAIDALDNIDNYGIYAQNLRDPKAIQKAFGPSIPTQRPSAAFKDWDSRSEESKRFKLIDIEKRAPEDYKNAIEDAKDSFEKWETEGNDGDIIDYLLSLSGKELPKDLIGKRNSANGQGLGRVYYPTKTPANLKKYAGRLEKDVHFMVKDDKIIFPLENSPYKPKTYLQKVMKTIMDNSGLEYEIVDVEKTDDAGEVIKKPEKKVTPPLSVTADTLDKVEKIRSQFQKEIGDVPSANYKTEPVDVDGGRKYKLVVTGISPDQRQKLLIKKASLKEGVEFDLDLYLMQKRAGL
jgi:glutaredoxin